MVPPTRWAARPSHRLVGVTTPATVVGLLRAGAVRTRAWGYVICCHLPHPGAAPSAIRPPGHRRSTLPDRLRGARPSPEPICSNCGVDADLIVCGLGPAGRALACRAARHGLSVIAIDPQPARRWQATYAAWADDLPAWLAPHVVAAATERPRARGTRWFTLARGYLVFDTAALQDSLDLSAVQVIATGASRSSGRDECARPRGPHSPRTGSSTRAGWPAVRAAPNRPHTASSCPATRRRCSWIRCPTTVPHPGRSRRSYTLDLGNGRTLYRGDLPGPATALPEVLRRRLQYRLRSRAIPFDRIRCDRTGGNSHSRAGGRARAGSVRPAPCCTRQPDL